MVRKLGRGRPSKIKSYLPCQRSLVRILLAIKSWTLKSRLAQKVTWQLPIEVFTVLAVSCSMLFAIWPLSGISLSLLPLLLLFLFPLRLLFQLGTLDALLAGARSRAGAALKDRSLAPLVLLRGRARRGTSKVAHLH